MKNKTYTQPSFVLRVSEGLQYMYNNNNDNNNSGGTFCVLFLIKNELLDVYKSYGFDILENEWYNSVQYINIWRLELLITLSSCS